LGELDSSLFKTTTIRENFKLQFRAEFFNLLNRTNLGLPIISTFTKAASGASLPPGNPSPSAGQITYTSTTSRQIQLGLKLLW
jgi:hypothetical protein